MRKIHKVLIFVTMFTVPSVFAFDLSGKWWGSDKPCGMIAQACKSAGFDRKGSDGKKFWVDCMRPVILGQTVKGVNIKSETVQACRSKKIEELKKELSDFQNAK